MQRCWFNLICRKGRQFDRRLSDGWHSDRWGNHAGYSTFITRDDRRANLVEAERTAWLMDAIEVDGKTIETTEDGFLKNQNLWDEKIMEALIKRHEADGNPPVGDVGRRLIRIVRQYYENEKVHLSMNRLLRMWEDLDEKRLEDTDAVRDALYQIFPHGPIPALSKLAGLARPAVAEGFDAG